MARVTVEDCIEKVTNRFELVMLASQRARDILGGAPMTVERDNDKNPVVALREIAQESISLDDTREELVRGYQKIVLSEESDEDLVDLMDGEEEFAMPEANESMVGPQGNESEELVEDGLSVSEDDFDTALGDLEENIGFDSAEDEEDV